MIWTLGATAFIIHQTCCACAVTSVISDTLINTVRTRYWRRSRKHNAVWRPKSRSRPGSSRRRLAATSQQRWNWASRVSQSRLKMQDQKKRDRKMEFHVRKTVTLFNRGRQLWTNNVPRILGRMRVNVNYRPLLTRMILTLRKMWRIRSKYHVKILTVLKIWRKAIDCVL